jgi:uncharacterized membrane protein
VTDGLRTGSDADAPGETRRVPAVSAAPDRRHAASPGHGHGHGHGAVPAASRHTRRIVTAILVPAAVVTFAAIILLWPGRLHAPRDTGPGTQALGTVVSLAAHACGPSADGSPVVGQHCGTAVVRVTKGPGAGQQVTVELPRGPGAPQVRLGDKVVMLYQAAAGQAPAAYAIQDEQRGTPMLWMLALTAAVIVTFGRWQGLASLISLAASFALLLLFVIPAILHGSPPLLVAVVGAAAMIFVALYVTYGPNTHTSVAVAGTLASLLLTGVLGAGFTAVLRLTGIGSDDDSYFAVTHGGLDMRGLLLAGVVIGALGVLQDVTVTQAVAVAEIAATGPANRRALYRAASRVGRAHVASAVSTIVLAYAGSSLPLLLLVAVAAQPASQLLTSEFLAQEVLRSAVGTIGLVASVPVTTGLAVLAADIHAQPRRRAARHGSR